MKYYFVTNPVAGTGISEQLIRKELNNLKEEIDYEIYKTKAVRDAGEFVKKKIDENKGTDICFIACGGDGTINEVFENCVYKDNVYVSCYPSGSGNDFVKCFGAEKFNVRNIINGKPMKIDVMKINDRYSINVTNFGIDTAVAQYMNRQRDKRGYGKKSDYTIGVLYSVFTALKTKVKIIADGKLLNPSGLATSITLSNGQYMGGSYHCAPKSQLNDGLIDVCIIRPVSIIELAMLIGPYKKGRHLDNPKFDKYITYLQAEKVEVIGEEGFEYTIDGENVQQNSFVCTAEKEAINFIVPEVMQ